LDARTKELLEGLGVDLDTTMARFLDNEELYFKFLKQFPDDETFGQLKDSLAAENADEAFRAAHTLKGVAGNLGLTHVFEAASDITEALRHEENRDMAKALSFSTDLGKAYDEVVNVVKQI